MLTIPPPDETRSTHTSTTNINNPSVHNTSSGWGRPRPRFLDFLPDQNTEVNDRNVEDGVPAVPPPHQGQPVIGNHRLCPDAGRSRLHREGATKLRRWMSKSRSKTEPKMAKVLHDYIRLRNSTTMEALARREAPELREAAILQDRIGWFELMHGKLAIQLVKIRETRKVQLYQ
jgi:hypothetical protein